MILLALVLLCASAGRAQVEVGENLSMNLNGTLGFGYGGGSETYGGSNHNTSFNGTGTLSGSYYHPSFFSFSIQPYYNRSQNNSVSQSIFNSSGITASTSIFSGSRFPGAVSFSKDFNKTGEFGIPGIGGLTTNGSAQTFSITWSALLPNVPSLTAAFSKTGSSSTVLGSNSDTETSFRQFNLSSSYRIAGFDLNGFFNNQNAFTRFPEFLGAGSNVSDTASTSYGASASHALPLSGTFGAGWTRTTFSSDRGGRGPTTTDSANASASVSPFRKLTVSGNVRYIGNLIGALEQELTTGGTPLTLERDNSSKSIVFSGITYYSIGRGLSLVGHVTHREQFYGGRDYSDTQYGGTLNYRYARPLFGLLYFSFGLVDNVTQEGNTNLGFVSNVGMTRRFGRWETNSDFSYSHNVHTLVATYNTSSYSYGTFVRRRLSMSTYWHGSFRGMHSGLTQYDGAMNRSESVSTGLTWRSYGVTGAYSQSTGRTVLTASGLLNPSPLAGLFAENIVLFDARSYSLGLTATPIRRLVLTANYAKVRSDTTRPLLQSTNLGDRFTSQLEYKLRKLSLRGGFTRMDQEISASGAPPSMVNSYYFGISRWFNIF